MMMRSLVCCVVLAVLSAACAAVQNRPSAVHNEAQKIMAAPSFNWQALGTNGVAMLPVVSKTAPEGVRNDAAFEVLQAFKNNLPNVPVLPASDAMEILRQNGMDKEFKAWLAAYRLGGPFDPSLLRRVGLTTARRYLLLIEVDQYRDETMPAVMSYRMLPFTGPMTSPTLSRPVSRDVLKDTKLTGRLWDTECRSIVWEGQGRARVIDERPNMRIRTGDLFLTAVRNFTSAFLVSAGTKGDGQGC